MKKNDCIVIGMGRLGSAIAIELNKAGENVTVIDKDMSTFDRLEEFSGFMINDDATDLTVLENNGVKNARKVIITTNSDNVNIFLTHICLKVYDVPEIYVRIADTDNNVLVKDERVKIINPFSLCIDFFKGLEKE